MKTAIKAGVGVVAAVGVGWIALQVLAANVPRPVMNPALLKAWERLNVVRGTWDLFTTSLVLWAKTEEQRTLAQRNGEEFRDFSKHTLPTTEAEANALAQRGAEQYNANLRAAHALGFQEVKV